MSELFSKTLLVFFASLPGSSDEVVAKVVLEPIHGNELHVALSSSNEHVEEQWSHALGYGGNKLEQCDWLPHVV